jgi:hypothetical protein
MRPVNDDFFRAPIRSSGQPRVVGGDSQRRRTHFVALDVD